MRWYQPLLYLWAAPATLLGLSLIPVALLQGGSSRLVRGVIEAHGGVITKLLKIGLPWVGAGAAVTLGHVVWGCDQMCLEKTREHERVHVTQYERWGPFFIPLYLAFSLVAYLRGKNAYRDNPFEREAFGETGRGVGRKIERHASASKTAVRESPIWADSGFAGSPFPLLCSVSKLRLL